MRRISMATRDELVWAVSERYGGASREDRGRILDEFAAVTGLHRKHAIRLLRGGAPSRQSGSRPGRRVCAWRPAGDERCDDRPGIA